LSVYRIHLGDELGSRLVPSSRPARVAARILGVLGLLVVVALVFVPWVQTSLGQGTVIARTPSERRQSVDSPIDGRVAVWHVQEGMRVNAGDPLVELVDNDADFDSRLAREETAARARIDAVAARARAIEERILALDRSRDGAQTGTERRVAMARERKLGAQEGVRAADAAVDAAKANQRRQRELAAKGLASDRTAELADMDLARAVAEAERARAAERSAVEEEMAATGDRGKALADASASLEEARATLAAVRADEALAHAELARVEVRQARQATRLVKAPRDGMVHRVSGGEGGEQVKVADHLLWLVPDIRERAVEIFIDGNDVPLVHPGRVVRLQFEGWPAVQWSGWPSVAVGTFGGVVDAVDNAADERGRFRVIVIPAPGGAWPDGVQLRQGARVTGWVLLDEVRLGWELWRQFNGFPPTSTPPASDAKTSGKKES
jgi:adhesin transport system membrane fusion protein